MKLLWWGGRCFASSHRSGLEVGLQGFWRGTKNAGEVLFAHKAYPFVGKDKQTFRKIYEKEPTFYTFL